MAHLMIVQFSPFTNWLCIKWLRLIAETYKYVYGNECCEREGETLGFAYSEIRTAPWSLLIDWINKWWCYHVTNLISFDWKHISWIYFSPLILCMHAYMHTCIHCAVCTRTLTAKSFCRLTINTELYLLNDNNNNDMYNSIVRVFPVPKIVAALLAAIQWKINRMI